MAQLDVMSANEKGGRSGPDMGRMRLPRGTGVPPVGLRLGRQSWWMNSDITSNYTPTHMGEASSSIRRV